MTQGSTPLRPGDAYVKGGRRYVVVSVSGPAKAPEVRGVLEGSPAHELARHEIAARRQSARSDARLT